MDLPKMRIQRICYEVKEGETVKKCPHIAECKVPVDKERFDYTCANIERTWPDYVFDFCFQTKAEYLEREQGLVEKLPKEWDLGKGEIVPEVKTCQELRK